MSDDSKCQNCGTALAPITVGNALTSSVVMSCPKGCGVLAFGAETLFSYVEKARTEERILSAAVQYRDVIFSVPAPGRHWNIAHAMGRMDLPFEAQRDQGFLTTTGRFVSRTEAWSIAELAGQIIRTTGSHGTLFSEDVW